MGHPVFTSLNTNTETENKNPRSHRSDRLTGVGDDFGDRSGKAGFGGLRGRGRWRKAAAWRWTSSWLKKQQVLEPSKNEHCRKCIWSSPLISRCDPPLVIDDSASHQHQQQLYVSRMPAAASCRLHVYVQASHLPLTADLFCLHRPVGFAMATCLTLRTGVIMKRYILIKNGEVSRGVVKLSFIHAAMLEVSNNNDNNNRTTIGLK